MTRKQRLAFHFLMWTGLLLTCLSLAGCNTFAGACEGLGKDLSLFGEAITPGEK